MHFSLSDDYLRIHMALKFKFSWCNPPYILLHPTQQLTTVGRTSQLLTADFALVPHSLEPDQPL